MSSKVVYSNVNRYRRQNEWFPNNQKSVMNFIERIIENCVTSVVCKV